MKKVAVLFLLALVVFSFTCCQSGYALENPDGSDRVKIFEEPVETESEQSGIETATDSNQHNTDSVQQNADDGVSQSKQSETGNKTTTKTANKTTDNGTVYITPTGKRYHFSATCGGKNSTAVPLEEALGLGLTPCGKCAK